ncbi:MAG: dipeptidase [Acidobacteria bacterium]|nr:dipeptidase [Acidobacteriota bacterium]
MHRRQFLVSSAAAAQLASPNESIQQSRDIALKVLAPSKRDLEHGLALHSSSLVVESYGFMPRAALDGAAVRQAIESGASNAEIQDLVEDHGMTRYVTNAAEQREYLDAWRASGVTCILQNAGEEGSDPMRLIKRLGRYTYVTHFLRDHVSQAVQPSDIDAAKAAGRHCVYMTGNGVPVTQSWDSVEEELRYIRIFFQLGVRMMHLTYNRRNMIGDGCGEPANAGLSDFGRAVVAEMNRQGVIPDVAHSGWRTSLEAAKASSKPMVASHTAVDALHHHIRAKPDEVIRAICDTGGLVGICCIPNFLGGESNIAAMLNHIDYVAKKFGDDHVAIGTDVAYTSRNAASESAKLPRRGRQRTRWEALWPPGSYGGNNTPEQVRSMAWTNWPLFTVGLVQRGYSDTSIRKIIGGNVMRVLRANFDGVRI